MCFGKVPSGNEVFFRDTANGFLAWAVALVVSVAFLTSAATSMAGSTACLDWSMGSRLRCRIYVDALFRSARVGDAVDTAAKAEAEPILFRGLREPQMPSADQSYLASVVATRTGMSHPAAEKRVSDVITQARQAEDAMRKATARLLLWVFVSLLIGALCASFAATIGGRQRDHVKTV